MTPGTWIAGRYRVERPLGEGGLGSAFLVRDRVWNVELALKLVAADASARSVLQREFLALRDARHPNLARVFDYGYRSTATGAEAYCTSALIEGRDLGSFAQGRRWSDVVRPVTDVLAAIAALHRRGLLHGDLHPGNVLVDRQGRAVVIDLSCVRPLAEERISEASGTLAFMAPELLAGHVHRSADFYALGKTILALGVELPAPIAEALARFVDAKVDERPSTADDAAVALGLTLPPASCSDNLGSALVGREPHRALVETSLVALLEGRSAPRTISLFGAEGSGRTRLLEEIKTSAQLRTTTVLVPGHANALTTALEIALDAPLVAPGLTGVLDALDRLVARGVPVALLFDDVDALPAEESARLRAFVRMVPDEGPVLVVLAGRDEFEGAARARAVEPLDGSQLRGWLRTEIPASALDAIHRETGGFPKQVAVLLGQLDEGAWDSRSLERAFGRLAGRRSDALTGLDDAARLLLARVLVDGDAHEEDAATVDVLEARGLLVRTPVGVRLLRRSEALPLSEALGTDRMREAHRARAEALATELDRHPERGDLRASRILHLAAFDPEAAARELVEKTTSTSGVALRAAVDAVVAANGHTLPPTLLRCAEVYADAGEPTRALDLVVQRLRRRPSSEERFRLRKLAGACYAQLGDSRRAARILGRLLPNAVGTPDHATVAAALSLALLKRGDDAGAAEVVRGALPSKLPIDPGIELDLHLNAAFAVSRSGDADRARSHLERARSLEDAASARGRFRVASATGFVAYAAGETSSAVRAYRSALERAETGGLDDVVPSAAMNYGSACHEVGDLGRALEAYERGHRLATARGMPTTEATLAFDRAKVFADIGSFDRAVPLAERALVSARHERMPLLEGGALAVLADAASARGEHDAALKLLDDAQRCLEGDRGRDAVSLALQKVRTYIRADRTDDARRGIEALSPIVAALGTRDVEAAWLGMRGRLATGDGRRTEAVEDLQRAVELAQVSGQRGLVAELDAALAEAYHAAGSTFLAERHRTRAREGWEIMMTSLPSELHDTFRRHPSRLRAFAPIPAPAALPAAGGVDIELARFLEINRRLNSASSTAAVLEETMDAAIVLTRAERGFLLVESRSDKRSTLKVVVARNMDRETLRQGNAKFSRTVAERVVRTGEPVMTVDAGFDPRFTKAQSIHAMKLKSLLCVPIRSPEGNLGAIYVDHRFSAGSFRQELVDVLLALGDQAALALGKARLVEDLRRKTEELEARNAEIERIAEGQAVEIARLKRAEATRSAPADDPRRRFDYGSMVAQSPAMRRVLSVLDRVIDTDITVLVRGESGTGKERVARAIHANSPRARGPFVAINCGALPESLLEAELFGYRRGAFSGAVRDQAGLFVAAHGGTLFLDELGEMPPAMQVKLLRVLQEREVRPLGANEAIATDVRLVCATNRDLAEEVRSGRFREDLFYRVAVVDVELPPLRERIEDILPLADATLSRLATELGRPAAKLDRRAERILLGHAFPGNVRELENVLTKAFLLGKGGVLDPEDLELAEASPASRTPSSALKARITATLIEADWNVVLAARLLSIPRATLYRKMRRYGIDRPSRR